MELSTAKKLFALVRYSLGFALRWTTLLSAPETILKLNRTKTTVYGLALSPHKSGGIELANGKVLNLCPKATPNCIAACVAHNGNGKYKGVQAARRAKTFFYTFYREAFLTILEAEIRAAIKKHNGNVIFRLNTFSDIAWHVVAPHLFDIEGFEAYDYTKVAQRLGNVPSNWHLTLSATEETTVEEITNTVNSGHNVAVVLGVRGGRVRGTKSYRPIPATFHGLPMVDGDADDNRAKDPTGHVVGLRAKGPMFGLAMAKEAIA